MNNQNLFKFLNKGISTLIGIFIIVLVASIVGGGILAWQYGWMSEESNRIPLKAIPQDWSSLSESCAKNEDCGTDFCQQKGDECIEIKYLCENEKCSSTTKEFPNYTCESNKCKEITEDETTNWKTYRNEEYRFEIKYPTYWKVIREKKWSFEVQNNKDSNNSLEIRTPLEAAGSAFINIPFDEDIFIADTIPARKKTKLTQSDNYKWWRIIIQWRYKKGGVIIYDYPYKGIEGINYVEIFNQMLSTFEFLE